MKWIKAKDRMPGWNVTAKWRMFPDDNIHVTTAKEMMGWASTFLINLEWLDESESPIANDATVQILIDALRDIDLYDDVADPPFKPKQFGEMARKALAQISTKTLPEPEDPFITKHLAIIKEKLLENFIQTKMQHLQRPPFDASVKYFLEKGTINGNFMLAIKDVIYGLPRVIRDQLAKEVSTEDLSRKQMNAD